MKKIFLFITLLFHLESYAQLSMQVVFENEKDSLFFIKNQADFPTKSIDSTAIISQLRGVIGSFHKQAYLESSFDFISKKDSILTLKFHLGNRYEWAQLRNGNVSEAFLAQIGYREKLFENKAFIYSEIVDIEEKLLSYAEDNGYPFAQVWLDSLVIQNSQISAALMMKTGAVFKFDTIHIESLRNPDASGTEGSVKISSTYLQNYLELKKGAFFSRSKILQISRRLADLPFLSERKKPTITFKENNTATINLFLENKKASRWDFLVGVQPNTTTNGSQKFTVTFNGNADFQNLLGLGERIFANFENLRPQSPRLNLKVTYPYILNFPFGFDGSFDLYKRDSVYIETHLNLGALYMLGGNDYLKLFWNNYKSNNLIINALQIIKTKQLPATLDISTNTFGLELSKQKLDYRFNPRRGWSLVLRGSAGVRQVRKNSDILNLKDSSDSTFKFSKLYDTLSLKNFQYTIGSQSAYYLPFLKRGVLKIGIQGGFIFTSAPISQNEQYRIGGNRILRGFNEESIFASRYAVGTLEYRFLLGRNSYLYAFGDVGYVEDVTRTTRRYDTPIGFGAGITFETKVGLVGFTLAAGREQGNPIDFRNTKTHFGYVSLF